VAEKLKSSLISTASRVETSFKQVPVELATLDKSLAGCKASLKLLREDVFGLISRLSRLAQVSLGKQRLPPPEQRTVLGVEVAGLARKLACARQRFVDFRSLLLRHVHAAAEVGRADQDMIGDLDEALKSLRRVHGLMLREPARTEKRPPLEKALARFAEDLRQFRGETQGAFAELEAASKALARAHLKSVGQADADKRALRPSQPAGRVRGRPGLPLATRNNR